MILYIEVLQFREATNAEYPKSIEDGFLILAFLAIFTIGGIYWIVRFFNRRRSTQRRVLEKKVELRTSEISKQKEKLQRAYQEIKTKNIAIEEAFEHLSNSYTKLSDLNREKDGMMNIVAHDLRTPLNNIEGLIQLVSMEGGLNDDQKNYISKISTVIKGGNEMIRDLLDINQAQNHSQELKVTSFSIMDFIENWKISFEKALLSKNQNLKITSDNKKTMIKTDSGILSRIMDNLMSNALKFSEKNKNIYLDINVLNDELKITMRDEGPGISKKDQSKMFKPFTRLTARPTNGEHSNGLGLSIIKSLTQKLGGEIMVNSTLGAGTSFEITIPKEAKENVEKIVL